LCSFKEHDKSPVSLCSFKEHDKSPVSLIQVICHVL
jgi:hypothetical protein